MKRLLSLLTVALLGAAAPAFADSELTPVFNGVTFSSVDPYTNQNYQGDGLGSYYTVRFNGSGTFYLSGILNSVYDEGTEFLTSTYDPNVNAFTDVSRYGITNYGYIDSKGVVHPFNLYNSDGTLSDNVVKFTSVVNNGTVFDGRVVTREGYRLGHFNAGDEIQIYLDGTYNDQSVWTATNSQQTGIYASRFGGRTDASNPEMTIGQLYFGPAGTSQMNFGVVAFTNDYTPGPAGSPLPGGVSIALVAGLFALGFWYIRRRKASEVSAVNAI